MDSTLPVPPVLLEQWAVPVLRATTPEDAEETVLALAEAGFTCVELTYSTPGVLGVISRLRRHQQLVIGLGTVTRTQQVREGAEAGARFLVSFANPLGFVQACREAGVPAIPGAFTPSEILTAVGQGASAVKLFPAHVLGPAYLGDVRAVLPPTPIMATGGIAAEVQALRPWWDARVDAVGIGSSLGTVRSLGKEAFGERVGLLKAAVAQARD